MLGVPEACLRRRPWEASALSSRGWSAPGRAADSSSGQLAQPEGSGLSGN
jgi:hypothetical protein